MILEINGLSLHFEVHGQGPALLLLHGWGDSSATWGRVAQALATHFQVFLIDLPGFGGSEAPPRPWDVSDFVDVIEKFIAEMELEQPFVLGHSHGGKIAVELAAAGCSLRGLILVASSGMDRPSVEVRAKVYFFKSCKWILSRCGSWGRLRLDALRERLGSRDYREAGPMRDTMVRVVNHKLFSTVPKISIPTLIIWGSKDETLPLEQSKLFRAALPCAYIRVLWDASHHPHLEQPAELAAMVLEFYEGYERQVLPKNISA